MSEKVLVKLLEDCVHGKAGSLVEMEPARAEVLEKYGIVARVNKLDVKDKHSIPSSGSKPQSEVSSPERVSSTAQPQQKLGEPGQEKGTDTKPVQIDPRLVAWLQHRGFRQLGEKPVWTKHDKIGERIVRLCVDFKNNPWGSRLAYVLDEETGDWKASNDLRNAEELLAYKSFRDELRKCNETKFTVRPIETTKITEAAPGVLVAEKDQQILVMVEEREEKQIMEEMMGEVLKEYVYQIPGQKPRLSYAGVKEAARLRGNIHVTKIEIEETKDGSTIIAKAEVYDLQNNFKVWGVAQQKKKMRLEDGREIDDEFCLTKAAAKAMRNGLRACIPEKLTAELISRWLETRAPAEGGRD